MQIPNFFNAKPIETIRNGYEGLENAAEVYALDPVKSGVKDLASSAGDYSTEAKMWGKLVGGAVDGIKEALEAPGKILEGFEEMLEDEAELE